MRSLIALFVVLCLFAAAPAKGLEVGICEQHFDDEVIWLMDRLGTKLIRTDVWMSNYDRWGQGELERLDRLVKAAKTNGIEVLFLFHDYPHDDMDPEIFRRNMRPDNYVSMLKFYLYRFPGVKYWQLASEQNGLWSSWARDKDDLDIKGYVHLYRLARYAVDTVNATDPRRTNSQAELFLGGLSGYTGATMNPFEWLDTFLQLGGVGTFDYLAYHPYRQGVDPKHYLADEIERLNEIVRNHYRPRLRFSPRSRTGSRAVHLPQFAITEYGEYVLASGGVDQITRGQHYQSFLEIVSGMPQVKFAFFYELSHRYCWSSEAGMNVPCVDSSNPGPSPDPESFYGLYDARVMTEAGHVVKDFILNQEPR